jgi:hypothetical protein
MSPAVAQVEFRGRQLLTIEDGGEIYVALRPVAEHLGLNWKKQLQKLKGKGGYLKVLPLETSGGVQETSCIPLRRINGWLFSINPSRVKPQYRDSIVAYQDECFEALFSYWHAGGAINPRAHQEQIEALRAELELVQAQTKLLKAADAVFGNRTPFGEISHATGCPKTIPVRGHLKSDKRNRKLNSVIQLTLNLGSN